MLNLLEVEAVWKQLQTFSKLLGTFSIMNQTDFADYIFDTGGSQQVFLTSAPLRKGQSSEPVAHFCLKKKFEGWSALRFTTHISQFLFLSGFTLLLTHHLKRCALLRHKLATTALATRASNKVNKPLDCLHSYTARPTALYDWMLLWVCVCWR